MNVSMKTSPLIVDEKKIINELNKTPDVSKEHIRDILQKARELKGISYNEVLALINSSDQSLNEEIFETAKWVKDTIYGNRIVLFAPIYTTNYCNNECLYCGFRKSNTHLSGSQEG